MNSVGYHEIWTWNLESSRRHLNAGSVVLHRLQHLDGGGESLAGGHREHAHDGQRPVARHQLAGKVL